MRSDWPLVPLGQLVDERGITYGVVQPGNAVENGVPLLRVNNFSAGGLEFDDVLQIDPAVEARYGRSRLRGGEVLLTLVGSTGRVAVADSSLGGWNVARAVGVIPVRPEIPSRWIAWCLQSPGLAAFLDARANTTVQKTLNLRDVAAVPVPLPEQGEIEAISAVLGALDDKIDSNRRLAALLEETTAALFKARFVDFVGVEQFEDSEIGPVPAGWRVGSLVDIARFVNGKAFTKDATGAGWPILRIRELNGGVDAQTLRGELNAADDNVARAGDILFAWSGSLGVYRWRGQESLINQHIFKVVPEGFPAWYVYGWINEHMDQFRRTASDRAVTMGHIKREHLSAAKLAMSDIADLQDADRAIAPLDQQRAALIAEQQTLTELRDALLPKLISGAIRVPGTADADEVIGPLVEAAP